jgi:antitoxin ParD1/3/4
MLAHKQYITITDPARLELTNLPFRKGQRVEVVLIAEDNDKAARLDELRVLFKTTQALPSAQAISDEMIAEEVEAYRANR